MAFREADAEAVLAEAFALYSIETVVEEVMAPTLVEVGERWHAGGATVTQEHFATAYLRRRLDGLFNAARGWVAAPDGVLAAAPLALTGAAPAEWHDVGILMVSLALRRHGWRVIYLGQNVPLADLLREVGRLRPDLVCLSATTAESAAHLFGVQQAFGEMRGPRPQLVVGGRAFNADPTLRDRFGAAYLGATARELITVLTGR